MRDESNFQNRPVLRVLGALSLLMVFLLAACQAAPVSVTPPPTPIDGTLTRPDLVGLIEWDRSPSAVVFRAQEAGGDPTDFLRLGDIPDCTIYGDNSMVYLLPGADGGTVVAVDKVSDEAVRTFIEDLTLNYQLFNLASNLANTAPELVPPSYQTLSIAINGQSFTFDSITPWDAAYYPSVVERCRAASAAPAEFAPENGAWVTVRVIPYDTNQPAIGWDATLDFATLADGQRHWLTGASVVALWDSLRSLRTDLQIQQGGVTYQAMIQVPGITPNAPAAP